MPAVRFNKLVRIAARFTTVGATLCLCLLGPKHPAAVASFAGKLAAQLDSAAAAIRSLGPAVGPSAVPGGASRAAAEERPRDALRRLQESLARGAAWAARFGVGAHTIETLDEEDLLDLAQARGLERRWRLREAEESLIVAVTHAEGRLSDLQADGKHELQMGRARLGLSAALTHLGIFRSSYADPSTAIRPLRRAVELLLPLVGSGGERPAGETSAARAALARAKAALGEVLCAAGGGQGAAGVEAKSHFGAAIEAVHLAALARGDASDAAAASALRILNAQIHADLAVCLHVLGELGEAKAMTKAARGLARDVGELADGRSHVMLQIIAAEAAVIHDEGRFAEALSLYEEYLAAAPTPGLGVEPSSAERVFEVIQNRAFARMALGETDAGLALLDDLQDTQSKVNSQLRQQDGRFLASGSPSKRIWDSIARTSIVRAELLLEKQSRSNGDDMPETALLSAKTAVKHLRRYRSSAPALFNALNTLGNVLEACRESSEASAAYREALEIGIKLFGSDSVLVAAPLQNLGTVLSNSGQHAEALDLFRRSLRIEERTIGFANPDTSHTYRSIALTLWHFGDGAQARAAATKAAESARLSLPEHHREREWAEQLLAELLRGPPPGIQRPAPLPAAPGAEGPATRHPPVAASAEPQIGHAVPLPHGSRQVLSADADAVLSV